MEKITINKSQINYFTGRTDDIRRIKIRDIETGKSLPEIKELSKEEKLGQIRLGQATLSESITPDNCSYDNLLSSFEYVGEDVIEAKKLQLAERVNKITEAINDYAQDLDDRFVLFEFKTSVQIKAALKEFKDKNFAEKYIK